jgi:hypothetical protein
MSIFARSVAPRFALLCLAMKMSGSVTAGAHRDEILLDIVSQSAVRTEVVDLKISRYSAILAAPPIAREYCAGELAVGCVMVLL